MKGNVGDNKEPKQHIDKPVRQLMMYDESKLNKINKKIENKNKTENPQPQKVDKKDELKRKEDNQKVEGKNKKNKDKRITLWGMKLNMEEYYNRED